MTKPSTDKPRLLLVHPKMGPPGGGEGVGAWAIEALRDDYDITVVCWRAPDREGLNRHFGTSLREGDYRVHRVATRIDDALDRLPTPLTFLRLLLLGRACRRLAERQHFDVFVSTANEFAFPRRGLQYVHFPTLLEDRPDVDKRWIHRVPGMVYAYRRAAKALGRAPTSAFTRNLTLVNSDFIGESYRALHGAPCEVLHPPIPGEYRAVPLGERRNELLCVGRISPEKRLDDAIEIVRRLREAGHDLKLHIAGKWDCDGEERARHQRLFAQHSSWVIRHEGLDRAALVDLMHSVRYGLHCMIGEHFGMAPAEMQRAGCLVFAHSHGGPAQILGGERALLFDDVDQAVARIAAVLRDEALRDRLEAGAQERREWFTEQRFMEGLRRHVASLLPPGDRPTPVVG